MNIQCTKNIIIDAETISIREKDICLIINISDDVLSQIESIKINGFKFVKEIDLSTEK